MQNLVPRRRVGYVKNDGYFLDKLTTALESDVDLEVD